MAPPRNIAEDVEHMDAKLDPELRISEQDTCSNHEEHPGLGEFKIAARTSAANSTGGGATTSMAQDQEEPEEDGARDRRACRDGRQDTVTVNAARHARDGAAAAEPDMARGA